MGVGVGVGDGIKVRVGVWGKGRGSACLAAELQEGRQIDLVEVVLVLVDRLGRVHRDAVGAVPVEGLVEVRVVA